MGSQDDVGGLQDGLHSRDGTEHEHIGIEVKDSFDASLTKQEIEKERLDRRIELEDVVFECEIGKPGYLQLIDGGDLEFLS